MRLAILALLASSAACTAAGTPIDPTDVRRPTDPFTIGVDAELADEASHAVALWVDASDGAFAGTLVIGGTGLFQVTLAPITECGGYDLTPWGCFDDQGVRVSTSAPADQRVKVIAHELGHTFGLADTDAESNLMNAPWAQVHDTCVQAEVVAAAGMTGPGACL